MTLIRILASRAVAAMRYSCTRQLKLQYRITYTKKGYWVSDSTQQ